jgi:hypothetical protein
MYIGLHVLNLPPHLYGGCWVTDLDTLKDVVGRLKVAGLCRFYGIFT